MQRILIVLFFLIKIHTALSQSIKIDLGLSSFTLTECLTKFEKEHGLLFSYANKNSDAITITLNNEKRSISLKEVRDYISKNTPFYLKENTETSFFLIPKEGFLNFQSIIYDNEYHLPIQNAIVTNITTNKKSYSNNKGFFKIEISHLKNSLTISNPLYETVTINTNTLKDTIWLTPKTELLDEVIVKEYIQKGITKSTDGSIELNYDDTRILPGVIERDVLQNIQTLPGVTSPTESASLIFVRGGAPDQNNTLWNGIQVYNTGHFLDEISAFNPFITKKTTFYKSGTDVKYGNRVGGVISLESETENPTKNKYNIGSDLININADTHIKISKKSNILAGFRRSNTDIFSTFVDKNFNNKNFDNTRLSNENKAENDIDRITFADASLNYNLNFNTKNSLQINSLFITNKINKEVTLSKFKNNPKAVEEFFPDENILRSTISNRSNNDIDKLSLTNYGLSIVSKNQLSKKAILKSKAYLSKYNYNYSRKKNDSTLVKTDETDTSNSGITFEVYDKNSIKKKYTDATNELNDINFESFLSYQLNSKNKLEFGYQYSYNQGDFSILNRDIDQVVESLGEEKLVSRDNNNAFSNIISGKITQHTLSSELDYFSSNFNFNIGARLSEVSTSSRLFFEPRVFASLRLNKSNRITSSFEIKNQFINQISFMLNDTSDGLPNRFWILSSINSRFNFSDSVVPEFNESESLDVKTPILNSQQFTLGYLFKYKNFHADIEGYYNKLKGISSLNIGFETIDNTRESDDPFLIGSEIRTGIDVLLNQKINNYQLWLSYSYSDIQTKLEKLSKNSFNGNFEQPHRIKVSQTYLWKGYDFGISWLYAKGTPYTEVALVDGEITAVDPERPNNLRLPDFSRIDISAVKSFAINDNSKLIIGISLKNVLNRINVIRRTFNDEFIENSNVLILKQRDQFSLKFTPNILIRYQF